MLVYLNRLKNRHCRLEYQFMGLRLYLKDLADCRKLAHSQVDQLRLQ